MTVVGRVVAAVVVTAGSIALGGPVHAAVVTRQAAGQITSPADGQVVSSGSVPISAQTGLVQLSMAVYVEGPSTPKQKVAEGGANQTISGTFDAGNAPNGTFNVVLSGGVTGASYATSTFKLRRPASAPANVTAAMQGTDKMTVTWSKGPEPDLQSYEVSSSASGVLGRLPVDSACAGTSCKATLAVPAKQAGHKVSFTVKAFRGDGDGGSIESGSSGAAYVTIPKPTATPKKSAKPTPKAGATRRSVHALPTLAAKRQSTAPRAVKNNDVPAIPDTDPKGNLPIPAATGAVDGLAPDGDAAGVPVDSAVTAQSSDSVIGVYGFYIAAGLLLLVLAAHAGAWARRRAMAGDGRSPTRSATGAAAGGAATAQLGMEGVAPATAATRRPAVVLAVAKPRQTAEHTREKDERGSEQVRTEASYDLDGRSASERNGTATASRDGGRMPGAGAGPRAGGAGAGDGGRGRGGEGRRSERPDVHRLDRADTPDRVDAHRPGVSASGRGGTPAFGDTDIPAIGRFAMQDAEIVMSAEQVHTDVPLALSRYLSDEDMHGAPEGQAVRPEPVRLALPSSVVRVVPDPPAAHIEDRWDDYLPPAPRAMEDSGFWERPLTGDGDFWAADEDENAMAGRRHRGGDS